MFIIQCPILWNAEVCALPSAHSSLIYAKPFTTLDYFSSLNTSHRWTNNMYYRSPLYFDIAHKSRTGLLCDLETEHFHVFEHTSWPLHVCVSAFLLAYKCLQAMLMPLCVWVDDVCVYVCICVWTKMSCADHCDPVGSADSSTLLWGRRRCSTAAPLMKASVTATLSPGPTPLYQRQWRFLEFHAMFPEL